MRHVEIIPEMRRIVVMENNRGGEFDYDIRTSVNVTMYLSTITI
jgi:hypothetical protein